MKIYFHSPYCPPSGRAKQSKQMKTSRLYRAGSLPEKIVLVMRLSAILLLLGLSVSAATSAQSMVTFSGKDVPLEQVFAAVKKQTGFTFVYYTEVLQGAHKVTIDVKGFPIEEFLELCLKDEPLTWKVIGQTVMIAKKEVKSINIEIGGSNLPEIRGQITNENGQPLAGASVIVKGSKKGTLTDEKGGFILKNIPGNAMLEISFTGYQIKEVSVNGEGSITVALAISTNSLDQVQIIAYGTSSERLNSGDVTTVSAKEIEQQPVDNPLLALEGRVPGLYITQATGLPGSGVTVQIRGLSSMSSGTDPFYVIDGVPYTSQLLPNLGGILGSSGGSLYGGNPGFGNPLSYINPSDIESISVLKDAAATAIYGSRAANGAILITTKKGKAGQTRVDINCQSGWGEVTRKLHLMNLEEYLQMRHEAINNDGLATGPGDYDINGTWDTTRSTDWQKTLIGGQAEYSNLSATISGGNTTSQYLVGGTFHRQTTVYPGDFADQKGSVHFNINSISNNQKFKFQLSGNYMIDDNHLPNTDLTSDAITLAPDAPSVYTYGSLNWAPNTTGAGTWLNPVAQNYNTYQSKTYNLISNALLSYQIAHGLNVKINFGHTNLQVNEDQLNPLLSIAPENRATTQRIAQYANNNINSWIVEPQVAYNRSIGKGIVEALIGSTANQINSNGVKFRGIGYNSDQVLADIYSASTVQVQPTVNSVYNYDAVFGRVNYNWQDKYIVDLTARRDGSSRFGPQNQFHDFGAVGLSWIFSQESFIKNNLSFVSFGKLRASYGTTGNDQIGNYTFLSLYSPVVPGIPYQGATGLAPIGLTNPYLEWELTKKSEVGIDLGFLHDRILFNLSYYENRSSNQLLEYSLPWLTGFQGITENFPATIQNSGFEVTFSTINVKTRDFTWSTHINLSHNQNKLAAFPNLATSTYAGGALVVGRPLTDIPVFHYLGVNPITGVYQFSDGKKGTTPTPDTAANFLETRVGLVNTAPVLFGGLENSFQYKGFELDILFQFAKKIAPNYFFGTFLPGLFDGGQANQPAYVLNRWQKSGDIASHQRYSSGYGLAEEWLDAIQSDASYSDASYIRLKNLSLSWQLPHNWKKGAHIQNASLFIHGQNLLTITRYKGLDPETQSSTSLPPLRILTFGLQVGL